MIEVTKLPVNCSRLLLLDETTAAAACGVGDVYFCALPASTAGPTTSASSPTAVVEVDSPAQVDSIAPWHPPGASLQHCGVFHALDGDVHFRRHAACEQRSVLQLPPNCGAVREMEVVFGTTLVLRTDTDVLCYALDPTSRAETTQPPLIGRVALPHHTPTRATGGRRKGKGSARESGGDEKESEEGESVVVLYASPSPTHSTQAQVDADCTIALLQYCRALRCVDVLLLAVTPSRVAVLRRTRNGGLPLPQSINELRCWAVNWAKQELLFVHTDSNNTTNNSTCVLRLQTMEWGSAPPIALPQSITAVQYTHTGEMWSLIEGDEKSVKLMNCTAGTVMREVELPHTARIDNVRLAAWGSSVFVLIGKKILEIASSKVDITTTSGGSTLCDWLLLNTAREQSQNTKQMCKERTREIEEVVVFIEGDDDSCRTMIVRDGRYVSSAPDTTGIYHHAVLDAMEKNNKRTDMSRKASLVKYIAVAQSLHPVTILRVLRVHDVSLRLSLAVLLASKPSLTAGGVRLLEWGTPVRDLCRALGEVETKRFAAALYETALAALASGALSAVEFLCAVADVVIIAAVGNGNRSAVLVSREEAEAEEVIAHALGVLASYAQWTLATAPVLGIITAHVGPQREGKKEAAVRDRVAHAINTSRSVQIEPMVLGRR